jgi:CheY-like chemotaxis protein
VHKKILVVVENDQMLRVVLTSFLRQEGCTVQSVRSSKEALDLLAQTNDFSLIVADDLSDLHLFIFLVKLNAETYKIPIILAIGHIVPGFEHIYAEDDVTFVRKSGSSFTVFIERLLEAVMEPGY